MKFIEHPNLPETQVCALIAGEKYKKLLQKSFEKLEIQVFWLPDNPFLPQPVSGHADMSIIHLKNELFYASEHLKSWDILSKYDGKLAFSSKKQLSSFPDDILFNACQIKNTVIHDFRHTAPELADFYRKNGFRMCSVRQAYSKCSICVVSENAVITADEKIAKRLSELGFDILLISAGHIELTGYDSGFIGGCSGKLAKDVLAFTGRLNSHPDRDRIEAFAAAHGCSTVYLTDEECFDIGSMIPVMESC